MSRSRFEGKVVFVTGGCGGLGAETSQLFIDEGAKVFVTDLDERSILKRLGPNASFYKCDVSSPEECETAIKACVEKYGRLDILFHNAARLAPVSTVENHDVALFQAVISTNLLSAFYLARVAIPQMRKQGGGVIVNTASTAALYGDYGLCAYSAAKAGIMNLTRTMALDHAAENIRINAVCPGYMQTPMTVGFSDNPDVENALKECIAQRRGSHPIEVARTVLFLASEDASYMNGHALVVDGGWTAGSGGPNFLKHYAPQSYYTEPQVVPSQTDGSDKNGLPPKDSLTNGAHEGQPQSTEVTAVQVEPQVLKSEEQTTSLVEPNSVTNDQTMIAEQPQAFESKKEVANIVTAQVIEPQEV